MGWGGGAGRNKRALACSMSAVNRPWCSSLPQASAALKHATEMLAIL